MQQGKGRGRDKKHMKQVRGFVFFPTGLLLVLNLDGNTPYSGTSRTETKREQRRTVQCCGGRADHDQRLTASLRRDGGKSFLFAAQKREIKLEMNPAQKPSLTFFKLKTMSPFYSAD